jgi:4a-hydroxytetrahydrobiopterin dehydratase
MSAESDWSEIDGALRRSIRLPTFVDAIAFVDRLAELAERENHHPDIDIRYRTVTVAWTTHSAGGITERDRALAAATDELLAG